MKFLEMTDVLGDKYFLDRDKIAYITNADEFTINNGKSIVCVGNERILFKETPEEILQMIEENYACTL